MYPSRVVSESWVYYPIGRGLKKKQNEPQTGCINRPTVPLASFRERSDQSELEEELE
jgi:hypothetical protein